ncbi:MAG: zf-HC2 domain-containing protein [Bacillota bacterium]
MSEPIRSDGNGHKEAEELLPWYATGQLEPEEQALVEKHLSSCAHCRRQLAFEREMIGQFAQMTPEVDNGWARLRQRLQQVRPARTPQPRQSLWDRIAAQASSAWQAFSRPAIAAIAAVQLAFVCAAGMLLYSLSQPSYQALGSAPPPQSANVIAMFRSDTTASQLNALLRNNGASLVGGPTPTDAYLLRVPAKSREAALERLRADAHVVMAQPIDGGSS